MAAARSTHTQIRNNVHPRASSSSPRFLLPSRNARRTAEHSGADDTIPCLLCSRAAPTSSTAAPAAKQFDFLLWLLIWFATQLSFEPLGIAFHFLHWLCALQIMGSTMSPSFIYLLHLDNTITKHVLTSPKAMMNPLQNLPCLQHQTPNNKTITSKPKALENNGLCFLLTYSAYTRKDVTALR